jgi:hypothetical protein
MEMTVNRTDRSVNIAGSPGQSPVAGAVAGGCGQLATLHKMSKYKVSY